MNAARKARNMVVLLMSLLVYGCNRPLTIDYEGLYNSTTEEGKRKDCLAQTGSPRGCLGNDAPSYKEYKKTREQMIKEY